jgi:hypothetical protein
VYLIRINFALKKMMINDTETPGILRYFPTACLFCLMVLLVAGYAGHNLYRSTWYSLAALSGALAQISSLRRMPVEGDPAPENELSESVGAL